MNAEYLIVDYDAQRQEIKHVGKVVPDVGITILASTFGIESVRLGDASRFMVTAD